MNTIIFENYRPAYVNMLYVIYLFFPLFKTGHSQIELTATSDRVNISFMILIMWAGNTCANFGGYTMAASLVFS